MGNSLGAYQSYSFQIQCLQEKLVKLSPEIEEAQKMMKKHTELVNNVNKILKLHIVIPIYIVF